MVKVLRLGIKFAKMTAYLQFKTADDQLCATKLNPAPSCTVMCVFPRSASIVEGAMEEAGSFTRTDGLRPVLMIQFSKNPVIPQERDTTLAFGIDRQELQRWKERVMRGEIAFLTHYWLDSRFKDCKTVTKVGCSDIERLSAWCVKHGLEPRYIHRRDRYPHFDLIGKKQKEVLVREKQWDQLRRFGLGGWE